MGDASSRQTKAKLYKKTQIDVGAQVVARADDADAGYQFLYDNHWLDVPQDVLVLDGPLTEEGAAGVRFHANVSFAGVSQGAGDVQYGTFDLKPAYSALGVPKVVDVGASSSLTFTAIP